MNADAYGTNTGALVARGAAPVSIPVSVSSSGANTVVPAVVGRSICVLAAQLVANAAVNIKWQSAQSSTDLTGLGYLAQNGGYILPFNGYGWFQTLQGEGLSLNLSGAFSVGGSITYTVF